MSVTKFEKLISKYELTNQCILLQDDAGNDHSATFSGANEKLLVRSGGMEFDAILRDFYVKDKFKLGIYFPHEDGHVSTFFFERSVTDGKHLRIEVNRDAPTVDGKVPVDIEVFIITHH